MFEYALHRLRHDELLRQGEEHRLAREATRLRREATPENTEAESHPRHHRFTRAA